jgi:hypothetical protein
VILRKALLRRVPARHMLLCRLQCVTRAKPTDNMSPAGGKHPHPDDIDCSVMPTSERQYSVLYHQCYHIGLHRRQIAGSRLFLHYFTRYNERGTDDTKGK